MKNVYIEITNVCNLACSFCPGHEREARFMSPVEFCTVMRAVSGEKPENIFLHVMGEPLLHPELDKILKIADEFPSSVKITTNGTLLREKLSTLLGSERLKTVCISLHSFEANAPGDSGDFEEYLENCFSAAKTLAENGKFAVLRLWNDGDGGKNTLNEKILARASEFFPPEREEWVKNHRGVRIATHVFVEYGEKFDWPDEDENEDKDENKGGDGKETDKARGREKNALCHGLLTQAAVLADGTVVPCCLDRNGRIPLGNIYENMLGEILSSARARTLRYDLEHRIFREPLCASCGFAAKRK